MSKKIACILIGLLTLLTLTCALAVTDKIVAIVNDKAITLSELNRDTESAMQHLRATSKAIPSRSEVRKKILQDMINRQLEMQLAQRSNITVSDEDVTKSINGIAARNHLTMPQFQQALQKQGMDMASFRKQIHDSILLAKVEQQAVGHHITISDQEIANFMHTAAKETPTTAKIYHALDILIPLSEKAMPNDIAQAKKAAKEILHDLKNNSNVKGVIDKAHEKYPNVSTEVSDFGWRPITEFPSIFVSTVTGLNAHQVGGPVTAPNGLHLIYLLDVKTTSQRTPSLTKEEARELVFRRKMAEAVKPWLQQLRATGYVQIYLED